MIRVMGILVLQLQANMHDDDPLPHPAGQLWCMSLCVKKSVMEKTASWVFVQCIMVALLWDNLEYYCLQGRDATSLLLTN